MAAEMHRLHTVFRGISILKAR